MTLPNERIRSMQQVADFLLRLASPYGSNGIKRIPTAVRREARCLLRHYPTIADLHLAHEALPDTFGKPKAGDL